MASKRIDELDARVVADADLLPVTPSGGPSGRATVAAVVAEGLSQPNSASSGAGASITIKAADGVTSGAGGSIVLQPGVQATTGNDGSILLKLGSDANAATQHFNITSNYSGQLAGLWFKNNSNAAPAVVNVGDFRATQLFTSSFVMFQVTDALKMVQLANTFGIGWTSSSSASGTADVGLRRGAKQIVIVDSGAASSAGGSFAYKSNTPAAITANQNDYVLTGSAFQRLNCTTASDITGIAPPTSGSHVDGRMIRLVSVGTNTVRLMHNDTGSTAANRIYMHSGTHVSLTVNEWADLVYDSTDNGSGAAGWRVVKYA
jgi:hypothetical protein